MTAVSWPRGRAGRTDAHMFFAPALTASRIRE
jgi:hypothetical protein